MHVYQQQEHWHSTSLPHILDTENARVLAGNRKDGTPRHMISCQLYIRLNNDMLSPCLTR
jgi:hypothetical protein